MDWLPSLQEDLGQTVAKLHRGGTHRCSTPRGTLDRLRPLLPAMGITRIANVTGLDYLGIPVVMVTRPNSRTLAVSQGKGIDLDHAKASGTMETVESFHGERIGHPLKLQSYEELRRRHAVVDPLTLVSAPNSSYDPHLPILWIEGLDLMSRQPVWLPYETVHVNYSVPLPQGTGCFATGTNGLASGNHLLEALNSGICEVIERDADALWMYSSDAERDRRRLDLDSVDDPQCRALLDRYRESRIAVEVWNTTSDVGVASLHCRIFEAEDNPNEPLGSFFGAGCHPSRSVALSRALTEAAQSRLTYISGSRDDIERRDYRRPDDQKPAERHRKPQHTPTLRFQDVPTREHDTLNADLEWELSRLQAAGITQAIFVDLTIPEFNIPVVKVVIPGLEGVPDGPSYVPGARALAAAQRPG